ncbi:hypothetical protein PRIPAC_76082 [Pristionchus pacificus]|uniref:Uncharacterized protein n=1 Tax=Pristionchus pacificus TaxID=54126 RepID=A0A2A6BZX6_PRIPA|nr:hypothetical protein PRIPAC_76082 [Pristionchus pacificus]|eukprot:PDM71321.1 hypothetical protein PRIPAC_37728 [Pristionchus pacificus]
MALTVTIILAVLTTMTGIFWAATVDPLFGGFHLIWCGSRHKLESSGLTYPQRPARTSPISPILNAFGHECA